MERRGMESQWRERKRRSRELGGKQKEREIRRGGTRKGKKAGGVGGEKGEGRKDKRGGAEGVGEDSCVQRGDGAEKEKGEGDTYSKWVLPVQSTLCLTFPSRA